MAGEVRLNLTLPSGMVRALERAADKQDCRLDEVIYRALRNYTQRDAAQATTDPEVAKELQDALEFRARYCQEFKPGTVCAGMRISQYRPGQFWLSFQDGRQFRLWLMSGEA